MDQQIMTIKCASEQPQEPKQYICDDDDLGCLHDYLVAAIYGNDISELPRLWNQQIGVIHSHPVPHSSAGSEPAGAREHAEYYAQGKTEGRREERERELRELTTLKQIIRSGDIPENCLWYDEYLCGNKECLPCYIDNLIESLRERP